MKKIYICPTIYVEDIEADITMVNSSKIELKTRMAASDREPSVLEQLNMLQNDQVVDLDEGGAKHGGYADFFKFDDEEDVYDEEF